MSLINRMLRDLSGRESPPGNVMGGIQVPAQRPRGRARRWLLLLAMVAVFTAVLWPLFKRAPAPPATPTVAQSGATAPATPLRRFQLSEQIAPATAPPRAAPRPEPRARRPAELQLEPQLQAPAPAPRRAREAPAAPAESAAPPPAEAPARPRDAREAEARYAEAQRALARGEPRSAEQGLREALELDPRHHAAREALVLLLLGQDRLAEAQSVLDEGLAQEPDRIAYRRLAARLDLARGQPEAAAARLERAPPPLTSDPEYHGLLASAYQRLNRHEEAARVYQSLVQLQPGEGHWWAGFGLSRDALGDRAGALSAYAQARQLGPLDARVLEHINRRTAVLQAGE